MQMTTDFQDHTFIIGGDDGDFLDCSSFTNNTEYLPLSPPQQEQDIQYSSSSSSLKNSFDESVGYTPGVEVDEDWAHDVFTDAIPPNSPPTVVPVESTTLSAPVIVFPTVKEEFAEPEVFHHSSPPLQNVTPSVEVKPFTETFSQVEPVKVEPVKVELAKLEPTPEPPRKKLKFTICNTIPAPEVRPTQKAEPVPPPAQNFIQFAPPPIGAIYQMNPSYPMNPMNPMQYPPMNTGPTFIGNASLMYNAPAPESIMDSHPSYPNTETSTCHDQVSETSEPTTTRKRGSVSSNKRGKKHFQGSIDEDLEKAARLNQPQDTGLFVSYSNSVPSHRRFMVIDEDKFYVWILHQRAGYSIEKASLFEKLNKSRACNRVNPKEKTGRIAIKYLRIDTNPQEFGGSVSHDIDEIRQQDLFRSSRLRIYSHRDWGYIPEHHFYYLGKK